MVHNVFQILLNSLRWFFSNIFRRAFDRPEGDITNSQTWRNHIWVGALLSYFEDCLYLLLNDPLLVGYSSSNQFLLLQPPTVVVKIFNYFQFWRTHFAWGTLPLFTWGVLSNLRDPFLSGNLEVSYIQHRRPARGQLVALKATFGYSEDVGRNNIAGWGKKSKSLKWPQRFLNYDLQWYLAGDQKKIAFISEN